MSRIVKVRGQWSPEEDIEKLKPKDVTVDAKVKIFRFYPSKDKKPYYDTFTVPLLKNMSVLGVLDYIYENLDSSLAFYYSCRGAGRCGGCNVVVNGRIRQGCTTMATEDMKIEPLPKREVIRDLVVSL